jgi:hypothetical protein
MQEHKGYENSSQYFILVGMISFIILRFSIMYGNQFEEVDDSLLLRLVLHSLLHGYLVH